MRIINIASVCSLGINSCNIILDMNEELMAKLKKRREANNSSVIQNDPKKDQPIVQKKVQPIHNPDFQANKNKLKAFFEQQHGGGVAQKTEDKVHVKLQFKGNSEAFAEARKVLQKNMAKGGGGGTSSLPLPPGTGNLPLPPPPPGMGSLLGLPPSPPAPSLNILPGLPPPPSLSGLSGLPLSPPPNLLDILPPPPSLNNNFHLPPPPPLAPSLNILPSLPPPLSPLNGFSNQPLSQSPNLSNILLPLPPPPSIAKKTEGTIPINLPPPPPSHFISTNPAPIIQPNIVIPPPPPFKPILINPPQHSISSIPVKESFLPPPPPPPPHIQQQTIQINPLDDPLADDEGVFVFCQTKSILQTSTDSNFFLSEIEAPKIQQRQTTKNQPEQPEQPRQHQHRTSKQVKPSITKQFFGKDIAGFIKKQFVMKTDIIQTIGTKVEKKLYNFNFPSIETHIRDIEPIQAIYADSSNLDLVTCYMQKNVNAVKKHNQARQNFLTSLSSYNWTTDPQRLKIIKQSGDFIPKQFSYQYLNYVQIKMALSKCDNLIKAHIKKQNFQSCAQIKKLRQKIDELVKKYCVSPSNAFYDEILFLLSQVKEAKI